MKNEYFDVAEALWLVTLICLIVSFVSPKGLILAVSFGISAVISTILGCTGVINEE
ncbi:hypothetical protein [uncultured Limosilactobacillus sp.]|uniref:hypothetical protein n=1 Tax=uncultured Limosilactobacillus sp. TaxID=2837629 RepID=UPI000B0EEEBA|nr:hypothetical protein [uncultured Limosilactobacillus sp.]